MVSTQVKHYVFKERNNSYYFSRANQQKAGTKIYSLTQFSLTANECDWHILTGNEERINSHCLIRWEDVTHVMCGGKLSGDDVGRRHSWHVHTDTGKLRRNKQSMLICKL